MFEVRGKEAECRGKTTAASLRESENCAGSQNPSQLKEIMSDFKPHQQNEMYCKLRSLQALEPSTSHLHARLSQLCWRLYDVSAA